MHLKLRRRSFRQLASADAEQCVNASKLLIQLDIYESVTAPAPFLTLAADVHLFSSEYCREKSACRKRS
jgi:hypothetical protein